MPGPRVVVLASGNGSRAVSSRELIFQRTNAMGRTGLYRISLDGSDARQMSIPQGGSDPDWSGLMD